jgi:cytochrome c biogenesis protein CcmG, thiol:disulfide interchange protein DsbE
MPRQRRHPALAALLAIVALLAACGTDGHDGDDASGNGSGAATSAAPAGAGAVSAVGFTRFDGSQDTFAAYRGKPLVVNFFASWCAPCVREMPEIERVHQELGDQVTFIGVDVRDRAAEGRKLAEQTGVSYELVRDPSGDILTAFGGALLPTTAFVTGEGDIAALQNHTYDAGELRAAIHEELLG